MEYFGCCGNICSLLSCYVDFRKKEDPPKYKEETYKVVFLGRSIIRFDKIEENSSEVKYDNK